LKRGQPPTDDIIKTKSDLNKSLIALSSQFEYSSLDNADLTRKHMELKGLLNGDEKSLEVMAFLKKLLREARA
jgi:hypothetical protein